MEIKTAHSYPDLKKISFYIMAHADDWQLFMCPAAFTEIAAQQSKVVFIVVTAGDAGMKGNYWQAREEGLKSSVRYCLAPIAEINESAGSRNYNDHIISYCQINNVTSIFLRLPDGNLKGGGFLSNGFQSLTECMSGVDIPIGTLDSSSSYNNSAELVTTMESVIDIESGSIPERWINYINPDRSLNPSDHWDHIAVGQVVKCMISLEDCFQQLFVGYDIASTVDHLSLNEIFWKTGIFAAYEKAVFDNCGYSTLRENTELYFKWCSSKTKSVSIVPATNK